MPRLQRISATHWVPKSMEVPQKAPELPALSCCAIGLRPGRLRRSVDHGHPSPDRGEQHAPVHALATPVDEIMESSRWSRATGSLWSRDADCAETMCCARRSTTCWPPGPASTMVLRALGEDNAELDKCDRVTIDSIRNHTARFTSSPERRQSNLPRDPRTPGKRERRRLRRGRGHRAHADCVF